MEHSLFSVLPCFMFQMRVSGFMCCLMKLCKCHVWMLYRMKEQILPLKPLKDVCCGMANVAAEVQDKGGMEMPL